MSVATDVPRCSVLDVAFFAGGFAAAVDLIVERARSGDGGFATLTSVHGLTLAQRDPAVREAMDAGWMNFPDGVPITWVQHRSGAPAAERVCGIDLMPAVLDRGRRAGLRHYLFGSTEPVLAALRRQIAGRWPDAEVVGWQAPPFGSVAAQAGEDVLERIRAAGPDIVWVGLGAPKQDLWCRTCAPALPGVLAIGVGAAFDFVAQTKRRAPLWMQRNGLEWLHRLAAEPRRLGGRYARANSEFVARVALSAVSGRDTPPRRYTVSP